MVNKSTKINKTKESLNSDGQQIYQNQQNKRKFKQWWSTNLPKSTKRTVTSHHLTEHKKTAECDVGNPDPGLRQTQTCGWVRTVNVPLCLFYRFKVFLVPDHKYEINPEIVMRAKYGMKLTLKER